MTQLVWDAVGQRLYETGVDRGVLYPQGPTGTYEKGYVWNGLTAVTESPSGAEANPQFADNIKYLNLISAEEFACTIEAFTYPERFALHDGTAVPTPGVSVGQQARRPFGFSYRTKVGNDLLGDDFGYKIHLVYGCLAAPSEKGYTTVNDSPEPTTFSWEVSTTPANAGPGLKPTATITIDSTQVSSAKIQALEEILYGTPSTDPRLPLPVEVLAILAEDDPQVVEATAPTFTAATGEIVIPTVTGVVYRIDGVDVTGTYTIETPGASKLVIARAIPGYKLAPNTDDDWSFKRSL